LCVFFLSSFNIIVMSKPFYPIAFGKFGKNVKDLFKKKYDYDHQFKVIHKTKAGETLESGAVVGDSAALKGYLKAKMQLLLGVKPKEKSGPTRTQKAKPLSNSPN